MYWVESYVVNGDANATNARSVQRRYFDDYDEAIDFANTVSSVLMVKYNIPGY